MTRTLLPVLAASLLVLAPSAAAVGPSLGTVNGSGGVSSPGGEVSYVTTLAGSQTRLARIGADATPVKSVRLAGAWGVPLVTINGETGGLSRTAACSCWRQHRARRPATPALGVRGRRRALARAPAHDPPARRLLVRRAVARGHARST